jgi:riboflavin kinase / FMN adenylyltransferase
MPLARVYSAEGWFARFGQPGAPAAVAIGNFDGVHLGHQRILAGVISRARRENLMPAVLTFHPHPTRVLRPAEAPPLLMTIEQRLAIIEVIGLDAALVMRFDEALAQLGPAEFVLGILKETMNARAVLVGENFRFGHRQAGDARQLSEIGNQLGLQVEIVPSVVADGIVVSSTAIRNALRAGDVEQAQRMLGRPFALEGDIRPGTGQGRKLVVPTLNLHTEQELKPRNGVYATEVLVGGKSYRAATNVGVRPTFDGANVTIESHLLDFSESLTSGRMEVRFRTRLREEQKFAGPDALREQVLRDIAQATDYFRGLKPESRDPSAENA